MSLTKDITEALVDELANTTFSMSFTPERAYLPIFELKDMKDLHVTVVPSSLAINPVARDRDNHEFKLDIGVQKKVKPGEILEVDALMDLVEEIIEHFKKKRLDGFQHAPRPKVKNDPIFSVEHLNEYSQFTSVISLTYMVMK